jgi:hypothetical protein
MKKICKTSFVYSIITTVYIIGIAFFMFNTDKIFGEMNSVVSVVAFLIPFFLSALVVGGLLLEKPIMMYIDSKKKSSLSIFSISRLVIVFL